MPEIVPRSWNLPLTYPPKIEPVRLGACRQTIRACGISKSEKHPGKIIRKEVGDLVRFYTWTGRPYYSSQKHITEYMPLERVFECWIYPTGIMIPVQIDSEELEMTGSLSWCLLDWLAALDGIIPPTGEALRDVLMAKNKIPKDGIEAQILRW